jgi:deoxyribodipyrimidine photo-lyase
MTSPQPIIVWFRDDLRLSDHPALHTAAKAGAPVVCLYVLDEASPARALGGAARWWLAQSLRALQTGLQAADAQLVLRGGEAAKTIAAVAREANANAVYWNDIAQAPHRAAANRAMAALAAIGVGAQDFAGDLLVAPENIRNKENRLAGVHAVLAARAIAGRSALAAARADEVFGRTRACERCTRKLAA